MSDRPLPRPVSASDFYQMAILDELRVLNGNLAQILAQKGSQEPGEGELIDLREPAAESTPLPADFPGRDALMAAGFDSLESVPKTGAALTAVSGIGKVTANQILTWLKVNS